MEFYGSGCLFPALGFASLFYLVLCLKIRRQ